MKTNTQDKSGRKAYRPTVFLLSLFLACGVALGQYEPPDLYGDANKGSSVLRRNNGQVFDTGHNLRPDVKYSFEGSPVGIALRDSSRISFSFATTHHDSVTPDTAYRVDMSIRGAKAVSPTALHSAAGVANYYRGSHSTELVPAFYRGVYQNIITNTDLHVYGSSSGPRMAFVMRPGSTPSALMLHFNGQDSIGIDWQGALKVYLSGRWVKLEQAAAYQVAANGSLVNVNWTASYTHSNGSVDVGFSFGTYNSALPLVLQIGYGPLALGGGEPDTRNLGWSTYMGGNGGDELTCVETDEAGNPYLCGRTWSSDFPVAPGNSVFQPFIGTAFGWDNAVVMKFQANNKQLAWATYYGGGGANTQGKTEAQKLAVYAGFDPTLSLQYVYAVGTTNCSDFAPFARPVTAFENAVEESYLGGQERMWVGAFRKSDGRRDWTTTHGESTTHTWLEEGLAIALGPNNELAVGGRLFGYNAVTPNFQLTPVSGTFSQAVGGGFVMLFNSNFTIRWSSTFGGYFNSLPYAQVTDMRITRSNSSIKLWLTGATQGSGMQYAQPPSGGFYHTYGMAFLASFDVPSIHLDYCTGWGQDGVVSLGYGLDFDGKSLWMVGGTNSQTLTDLDCPNPGGTGVYHTHVNAGNADAWRKCDGFILAFDPESYVLKYGTLMGGSYYDMLLDVNHDASNVYITGETRSSTTTFATDMDPNRYFQPLNANQDRRDAVILALNKVITSPTLLWRTAYGGAESERGWGIAASPTEVYITGTTASAMTDGFPLKEYDPVSPLDFYQDYNFGGDSYGFLEFYDFVYGLDFEHHNFGEVEAEPEDQYYDGFIASFSTLYHVGIDEVPARTSAISAIPMPMLGQWEVHFPSAGDWTLMAFDAAGQVVGSWRSNGLPTMIDLSAKAPGMYLLRATTSTGEQRGAKVIRP